MLHASQTMWWLNSVLSQGLPWLCFCKDQYRRAFLSTVVALNKDFHSFLFVLMPVYLFIHLTMGFPFSDEQCLPCCCKTCGNPNVILRSDNQDKFLLFGYPSCIQIKHLIFRKILTKTCQKPDTYHAEPLFYIQYDSDCISANPDALAASIGFHRLFWLTCSMKHFDNVKSIQHNGPEQYLAATISTIKNNSPWTDAEINRCWHFGRVLCTGKATKNVLFRLQHWCRYIVIYAYTVIHRNPKR